MRQAKKIIWNVDRTGNLLFEALLAVCLITLVVVLVASVYSRSDKLRIYQMVQGEIADLASYYAEVVDCDNTFDATTQTNCTGKSSASNYYVNVKQEDLTTVIKSDQTTKLGQRYRVRAKCIDNTGFWSLEIEALRLDIAGTAAVDPLSGSPGSWRDLSDGIPLACP